MKNEYIILLQGENYTEQVSFDNVVNTYGIEVLSKLLKEKTVEVGIHSFLNLSKTFTS